MTKDNKVLVIGLDGATFDLIKPWVAEGKLPTFKRLIEEGSFGELASVVPPATATAWPSMFTGKNPGKHGIFQFVVRKPGGYDFGPTNGSNVIGQALWDILGDQGKQVIIANVPMTYPARKVNGLMITGLLTPPDAATFTYPESLREEIFMSVGDYRVTPKAIYSDERADEYLAELEYTAEKRFEAVLYLAQRYPWDVLMVVFNATDMVQHGFWKHMDEQHPNHDPEKAKRYSGAILQIYQKMDAIMASIFDLMEEQTALLVLSDHGAGPVHRCINMNNWLIERGYMKVKKNPVSRLKYWVFRHLFTILDVYELFAKIVSMLRLGGLREKGQGIRWTAAGYKFIQKIFFSFLDIDWSETIAYSLNGGMMGEIYINREGREPRGIVPNGQEYEKLRNEIISELQRWRDPVTGENLIGVVHKGENVFWGPLANLAPDLIPTPGRPEIAFFGGFEFMSNPLVQETPSVISAQHRQSGILMMLGESVRRGNELLGAKIIDIAPTILHLLDMKVPREMDGRVLQEAFEEEFLQDNPIQYDDSEVVRTSAEAIYSEEEEEEIKRRLRSLGYL